MEGVSDGDSEGVSVAAKVELHGRLYIGSETNSVCMMLVILKESSNGA